ncbi:hypothetical protein LCGC14_2866160, partial [marine sediment metagenome]
GPLAITLEQGLEIRESLDRLNDCLFNIRLGWSDGSDVMDALQAWIDSITPVLVDLGVSTHDGS